jgi:hypothetical protein
LPQVSKTLSDVLADQDEGFYGPNGYDIRPAPWKLPAVLGAAEREEAARALDALAPVLDPAAQATIAPWLNRLGAMVASNMSADEARVKAGLMASNLAAEFPIGVFTPETLRAAAREFKWFPSYAELAEYLDREARKLRRLRDRLEAVAGTAKAAPRTASVIRSAIRAVPGAA